MTGRWFSSLLLAVFENHGYNEVLSLPSHARLLASGAVHTAWYDVTHPSGPNYRSLVAGDYWSTDEFIDQPHPNLCDSLAAIGVMTTVVEYAGVPAARHDPYLDLHAQCARHHDSALPSPDNKPLHVYLGFDDSNNAHSAPLEVADRNLMGLLDTLDHSSWFNTRDASGRYPVLFFVWDEVYNSDEHVFAAWYGKGVKQGQYATWRNHFSFCRTVCDNYAITPLAHAAAVQPVDEVWL